MSERRSDRTTVVRGNRASFRTMAEHSPGGQVVEFDGVIAMVVPAARERPLLNGVFVVHPGAVEPVYERIERLYREAGVRAFLVWVEPDDERSASALAAHGHALDARPRLMAAEVTEITPGDDPALPLAARPSVSAVADLNDAVYGYPGSFARAFGGSESIPLRRLVALDGDREVACAAGVAVGNDFHVTLVATLPSHRGRGLAAALLRRLIADVARDGVETTSLVATSAGVPVYQRLGYRDVGCLHMWERHLA